MSESEWSSHGEELPKKKRRIPMWIWGCGGCAVLAVLGLAAFAIFIGKNVSKMVDQDAQWAALEEVLPCDERPTDLQMVGTGVFTSWAPGITNQWSLTSHGGRWQTQITLFDGKMASDYREQIASGDLGSQARQQLGPFGLFEVTHGTLAVQGRDIAWLRFQTYEKKEGEEEEPASEDEDEPSVREAVSMAFRQQVMLLDVTPEGQPGALIIQYQRLGGGEPIRDDEVLDFLRPFHVGPDR